MSRELSLMWAKSACWLTLLIGLVASGGSYAPTSAPWRILFDILSWPIDGNPGAFREETLAVNAVLGGVMVGWAVLMYLIITGPVTRGDTSLIRPLLVSIGAWFVVDSAGSLLAGLPGNVLLNITFLGLFLPPLLSLSPRRAP